jgi:hypothetical protein
MAWNGDLMLSRLARTRQAIGRSAHDGSGRAGAPTPVSVRAARLRASLGNQGVLRGKALLQRSASPAEQAPETVRSTLRTEGRTLERQERAVMEAVFGADFTGVRLHDDGVAGASARDVGARAYTVGRHIVFAPGEYRPSEPAGRALLAHELTHVVQQPSATDVDGPIAIGATATGAEREADAASRQALSGHPVRVASRAHADRAIRSGLLLRSQMAPPAILQRAPTDAVVPTAADAGVADAGVAPASVDEGLLRANAARELVRALELKKAVYGHELDPSKMRKAGWWWGETEFDCSKFVLWVLAGRQVGDPPLADGQPADKAIRQVTASPFGRVSDASSVTAMIGIVEKLAVEGKAKAIDKDRQPETGDLMFWGGHVAIVVDVQPTDKGDTWVVYANMGVTGAGLVGIDAQGHRWLKASEVADRRALAAGAFKGYWTP